MIILLISIVLIIICIISLIKNNQVYNAREKARNIMYEKEKNLINNNQIEKYGIF